MRKTEVLLMVLVATGALAQFSYDRSAPLDPQLVGREWRGATMVQDITYAGAKGNRVPAYLFTQPNASAAPAVVFMHWGLGDRHTFYDEAAALADHGVASLLIDAPFVRPDASEDENADLVQAVADVQRGIDLLAARKDVDRKRIAFAGLSYGAHVGALLAAQEPRLAGLILSGGLASNADAENNPALAPYDAEKWIAKPHNAPVFLQFARNDESISREQANRFIKAASDPAIYKWYEGTHAFSAAARADRLSWLAAHLGFTIADASYRTIVSAPVRHDIGRLGVVFEMPGMQQIKSLRDIPFTPDLKIDVYYPFAMKPADRIPAILLVNGQSDNPDFQKALRTVRFTTTMAQALAVRANRIVVVPDIRGPKSDPAADLVELMKYLAAHEDQLQVDASQIGILSRSAGYAYALRAAAEGPVKAIAVWYGNLADPGITIDKNVPALVVTCEHDFWSSNAAAEKFVDATGAQRIHLPDGDHGFEIFDDLEQSRDAFVKTAMFLREHLPVHRHPD